MSIDQTVLTAIEVLKFTSGAGSLRALLLENGFIDAQPPSTIKVDTSAVLAMERMVIIFR